MNPFLVAMEVGAALAGNTRTTNYLEQLARVIAADDGFSFVANMTEPETAWLKARVRELRGNA